MRAGGHRVARGRSLRIAEAEGGRGGRGGHRDRETDLIDFGEVDVERITASAFGIGPLEEPEEVPGIGAHGGHRRFVRPVERKVGGGDCGSHEKHDHATHDATKASGFDRGQREPQLRVCERGNVDWLRQGNWRDRHERIVTRPLSLLLKHEILVVAPLLSPDRREDVVARGKVAGNRKIEHRIDREQLPRLEPFDASDPPRGLLPPGTHA